MIAHMHGPLPLSHGLRRAPRTTLLLLLRHANAVGSQLFPVASRAPAAGLRRRRPLRGATRAATHTHSCSHTRASPQLSCALRWCLLRCVLIRSSIRPRPQATAPQGQGRFAGLSSPLAILVARVRMRRRTSPTDRRASIVPNRPVLAGPQSLKLI